jgi:alpha-beta hydrolase superfamily lysophospholipase
MNKLIILLLILLVGCKPGSQPAGTTKNAPELHDLYFLTEDAVQLPLHRWLPGTGKPRAVIVGVHGFNDYGNFLKRPAEYFSEQGIAAFTYDQRGFGAAPQRGYWAGRETYAADLRNFVRVVKQRYPSIPVYLLGESMGGAVAIEAVRDGHMTKIDGIILVAPALWPREIMPWYQTSLLWLLAHTVPWMSFSGEGVGAKLSDNREMMRELDSDPLVLRKTRVEALLGLTNLMDSAFENATQLGGKILLLYGDKDEIIPKQAIHAFLQGLYSSGESGKTVGFYPNGYHLLLRDLKADIIWQDIATWTLSDGEKALPSKADKRAKHELIEPLQWWQQAESK